MKNLPLSIQTFSKLIVGDYLYIDKTRDIYNLFPQEGISDYAVVYDLAAALLNFLTSQLPSFPIDSHNRKYYIIEKDKNE